MTVGAIGPAAVWVAIGCALVAALTGRRRWLAGGAVVSVLATSVLVTALLSSDFSLAYVAQTTSLATPWPYRLAGLWGGMSGSMLFYSSLTLVVAAIGLQTRAAIRVAASFGVGLLAITIFFANPFLVSDIPSVSGTGLLAILQHPAMVYHPPLLYLGLAVLVVPFARTVGLVAAGGDRAEWRPGARRWLYASWTLLAIGMAAGANWAYVELGWGGYWAWDPVENAALMPWLATTVFLHISRVEEVTGRLERSTVAFAALPFALTVLGVYLTRSGVSGSIHSFAEDPLVGRILLVAAAVIALAVVVMALRSEPGSPWGEYRLDRDGWLGVHAILLTTILVFVIVGSAYPAFRSVFTGQTVLVDSRFYVVTILPVAVLLAVALGSSLQRSVRALVILAAVAVAGSLLASAVGPGTALLFPAIASLVVIGWSMIRKPPRGRLLTADLAHLGMAVLLIGVAGSSFGDEHIGSMRTGDSVSVGSHEITLTEISSGEADRYVFVRATIEVDGQPLIPEIRAYEDQALPVAEPDLRSSLRDDVVVMVSLLFPDGETVAVSVFVRPLVWLVWLGAALMALSGLMALAARDGVVSGRRRSATAAQRPEGTTTGISPL